MEKNPIGDGTALAILLIAVCAIGLIWARPTGNFDWAAWAGILQALGTVVAIWWTYRTTREQFEAERKDREVAKDAEDTRHAARETAQMELIRSVAMDALEALCDFQNYAVLHEQGKRFEKRPARLEDVLYTLRGLMVSGLPSGTAIHLLDIQRIVSGTFRDCERYYRRLNRPDSSIQQLFFYRTIAAFDVALKLDGFDDAWRIRQFNSYGPFAEIISPDDLVKSDPLTHTDAFIFRRVRSLCDTEREQDLHLSPIKGSTLKLWRKRSVS